MKMCRTLAVMTAITGAAAAFNTHANGLLDGTVWAEVSQNASCNIDAELLYAVALVESRRGVTQGYISPHAYALRNAPRGAFYPQNLEDAKQHLKIFLEEDRLTDIGAMQINYRWNGHLVDKPEDLLNLKTNVETGAKILCNAIKTFPSDLRLGIGGYHTMNPERKDDAIAYGERVLAVWKNLVRRS